MNDALVPVTLTPNFFYTKLFFRFKLEETKDKFKKVFEDCQDELRKKETPLKDTPAKSNAEKVNKLL